MPEDPYINTIIEDLMNQVGSPPSSLIGGQGAAPNIDGALLTKEQASDYMNASLQDVFRKKESPLLPTMLKATDIDISGRFDKQAIGWDNEDLYGQAQSNWDKAANGLLKGTILAGTTFLQGTVGMIYGLANVVTGRGLNSFYNNDLSNEFQRWNKLSENALPNYYTARERNAEWWEPANLFTANFLFDKLVKNIGFSVGALYSGAAITKALKLVPELFGISLSQKAAQAANAVEEAANASNGVNRMGNVTNAVKSFGGKSLIASNQAKPFIQRALVSSLAAATEGGIESLQGINEYRNSQIEEYKAKFGVSPIGEDLAKINEYAENLGNSRFGLNMLLLTATNYVMLPKILGGSYRSSKSVANDLAQDAKGVFRSAVPDKGLPKLINRAKNISGLFFSRTESFEELSQYAAQKGVEDYYNKAFKGEGVNWLESISEGYKAALSDKEGLESGLIGGLSGGLQQAGFIPTRKGFTRGKIGERGFAGEGGTRKAATDKLLEALNGSKLKFKSDKWLADMAQAATRGINLQLEGEALVRQGDVLEAKDNEFDYLNNYLTPRIKHGRYDLVKDDITNYRQLAVTDFTTLQQNGIANENDTYETFTKRLNNFEAHADNVNSLYNSLNLRYGGVVDEENKRVYSDEVIDKMVYAASKIADYDQRSTQLNSELSSKGISAYPILDSIINNDTAPKDATEEALNQINSLTETSDVKDELKQKLQDVIELSFRKKAFLSQYDRIKKNPKSYKDAPVEQIPSRTAYVKQEAGERDLEIGKTYSLSTPFLNDNGQLSFKPEISIVSKTLGGEYEVKLPNGKTAFLSPQDFKKYQISDTPLPASAQLEAAINKAVGSVLSKNNIAAPATLQEKLSLINEANNLQLSRDVEQAVKEETKELVKQLEKERKQREEFEKNKALQDKLAASQTAIEQTSGDVGTPSPTKGRGEQSEDYTRAPLYNFPSKESMLENGEMKLHQQLRNNFLLNYDNFTEKQKAKIRVITVTADNEEFLGLKGFTQYALQETTPLVGQIPIVKLYITAENNGKFLIGEDGEHLSKTPLGEPQDFTMAVFGMFHEADFGTYKFGTRIGQLSYSKGTPDELKELLPKHKAWRENIIANAKDTKSESRFSEYEILGISRGVPELVEEENSVIGTFVEEKDLSRQLVQIPTKENDIQVVAEGKSLNFPIGQPVFVNGNTIEPLNNRQFTEKEINNLYSLIHKLSENRKGEFSETIISFLKGMLYWKAPKPGESIGVNQIWISKDGKGLLKWSGISASDDVQFTFESITANKDRLMDFLSRAYVNVNNLKLKDMQRKFYELQLKDDGTIEEIEHPNYQHFLLTGTKPFLTTNVRKISKDVPNDTNYRYKYSTLKGKEFERPERITPAKTAKQKPSSFESKVADIERRRKEALNPEYFDQFVEGNPEVTENPSLLGKWWAAAHEDIDGEMGDLVDEFIADTKEDLVKQINTKYNLELAQHKREAPKSIPVVGETQQATLTIAGTLFPINYTIEEEEIAIEANAFLDTLQTYLATTKNKNGNIIMDVLRSGDTEATNQEITVALAESLIKKQLNKTETIVAEPTVENDRRALSLSYIVPVPDASSSAKRADIERRRQDALNSLPTSILDRAVGVIVGGGTLYRYPLKENSIEANTLFDKLTNLKGKATYNSVQDALMSGNVVFEISGNADNIWHQVKNRREFTTGYSVSLDAIVWYLNYVANKVSIRDFLANIHDYVNNYYNAELASIPVVEGANYVGYYIKPTANYKGKTVEQLVGNVTDFRELEEIRQPTEERVRETLNERYNKEKPSPAKVSNIEGRIQEADKKLEQNKTDLESLNYLKQRVTPYFTGKSNKDALLSIINNIVKEDKYVNPEEKVTVAIGLYNKYYRDLDAELAAIPEAKIIVEKEVEEDTEAEDIIKKKIEERKQQAKSKSSDWKDSQFRVLSGLEDYNPANIEKELKYIAEKSGFDIAILTNILKTPEGIFAWGKYKNLVISLYDRMQEGTGYHELFHGVMDVFTNSKEKRTLYDEFRRRTGSFVDRATGQNLTYSAATYKQFEDHVADEFADFVLNGNKPQRAKTSLIERFFRNIWNFIKSILSGDVQSIDQLFARIDKGKYKSAAYKSIPGMVDVYSRDYRIGNLDATKTSQITRGVVSEIFDKFFQDKKSLVEFDENPNASITELYKHVYSRLEEFYTSAIYNDKIFPEIANNDSLLIAYDDVWRNISNNWENVKKLGEEYLKLYGIVRDEEYEDDDREANDDTSRNEYTTDHFKVSGMKTASKAIKLLIGTISEAAFDSKQSASLSSSPNDKDVVSQRLPETGMQDLVSFTKTFNQLLSSLHGLNTLDEKLQKLDELRAKFPNYQKLWKRLNSSSDNLLYDWKLKTKFHNVFSKQKPEAIIMYMQSDGSSYSGKANLKDSISITIQGWLDNLKQQALNEETQLVTIDEKGNFFLLTKSLKAPISTIDDKIEFLKKLDIPFTKEEFDSLPTSQKKKFSDAVSGLYTSLNKGDRHNIESPKTLGSVANLTAIAESKIIAGEDFDSTFSNIDGEPVQTFILPNAVSKDVNNFNNSQTIGDLIKKMPQLQATYARDSIYINDILFKGGKHTSVPLTIKYIQGIVDLKRNTATQNLSTPSRLLQEINQNLNDTYYILLPADSSTEGMLEMTTPISFAELRDNNGPSWNRIYSIFENYLLTESEMFNHDGKHRLLSELSNKYTATQEEFRTNLKNHVNSISDELFNTLSFYNVIKKNKDGTYEFSGIDKGFTIGNGLDFKKLSENSVRNILKFRNINTIINNIEIQKLFFGDPAEYIDPKHPYENRWREHFRRIKSFLSPRESSMYGNPKFNEFLNEGNKAGNIQLEPTDPGYHTNSDNIATIPMADVISTNELLAKEDKKYEGNNTSDSQAWAALPTYKELIIKSGFRWSDKHEYIYQYRMSQDRILMSRDKVYKYTNQKLREHDEKTVAEYEFPYVYFPVIKPIVSGHTDTNGEYHPILDKDSVVPLSYSFVRGTNMQEHYVKMLKQDIGYLIAESGRKVGNRGTDSFYNEDGSVNTEPYKNIVRVRFEDFGIQQETSGKKNTQTRVSQLTKLAIVNLYDGGVPSSPEVKALVEENIFLLQEQTNNGYNGLLKKLGIIDDDSQFIINDKSKVLKLLKDELLKREVTNNIKESLELNEEGEFLTAFEALPNYRQIKSILFSFVNKYIAKPRIAGGPKVQVSGALMEKYGIKRSIINGKIAYTSDSLQFYTKGKPQMEVLLPFHFAKQLREAGFKWEDEKELMAIISRSPDKDKILSGIGVRIPVQELNSVESFIIKGFLPEEMGDVIVVPEELTTKAGSDFDVDKLNTYLRNLVINRKTKEIRVASLFDVNTVDDEKLKDFYEENLLEPYKQFKITEEEKGVVISLGDLFETISSEEDDKLISDELERQSIPSIEEYMIESKGMDKYEFNRRFNPNYRKAIENAYYDNLQAILALSQNFKRLIKPNHSDELMSYRDKLVETAPGEFDTKQIKSIINPLYVTKLRHTFITGKGGIGIAATSGTANAVAQLSDVYIDPERISLLKDSNETKYIGDATIALPHNKSTNGFATISKILDRAGRYISDKIVQYGNGFVDIAKDFFIIQIGANRALVPTFLLLERLGVPSDVVVYFMSQPIIREYAKIVDREQTNFFYDEKKITEVRSRFKSGNKPKPTSFTEEGLAKHLLSNIEKYYTKKSMNEQDNAEQQFILDEFLKYYTIAQSLFRLTQGTNYDTQKFSSDYSLVFKELQYQDAQDNTIFNSAEGMLQSSFIGNVRNKLLNTSKALNTLSNLKDVKFTLNSIIRDFKRNYEAKETVGPLIEESYITYLIQAKLRLSNQIEPLVLNTKTALVNDLRRIKKEATAYLKNNILLRQMLPMIDNRNAVKNIRVAIKPKTVFQKELYTEAFQELLDHPLTEQFARNVARLNFLQAGISGNVLSMKDYMPIKLYSDTVNAALSHSTPEIAQEFKNVDAFYRNSWSNTALVPILSDGDFDEQTGDWEYKYNHSIPGIKGPLFAIHAKKREANMGKFLTLIRTDEQENKYKFLLERVEDANGPIITSTNMFINGKRVRIDKYIYTPVNAWGNGFRLQEYYDTIQPSKTTNGYRKIQQEIDHNDVIAQLQRNSIPQETPTRDITDTIEGQNQAEAIIRGESIKNLPKVPMPNVVERSSNIITRAIVKATPKTLYLFGDNDIRKGLGGQAKEMRGESNTVGISTKKLPSNDPRAFKTDIELEENKRIITEDVNKAITEWNTGKYNRLIIPPIGVGLAKLQEKAPLTWTHLQEEFNRLEVEVNKPTPPTSGQLSLFEDFKNSLNRKDC